MFCPINGLLLNKNSNKKYGKKVLIKDSIFDGFYQIEELFCNCICHFYTDFTVECNIDRVLLLIS